MSQPYRKRLSSGRKRPARSNRTILFPEYRTAAIKKVWLTIDDGPHPLHTGRILEALNAHGITCTFFVVGANVANHGALVEKAYDAGHRIGNHSFSHRNMIEMSVQEIRQEINDTHILIENYLGSDRMFRAPFGNHNALVDQVAAEFGYRVVGWNVDSLDWDKAYKPDKWIQHAIDQIRKKDFSTVLVHDIQKTTADNFAAFIDRVKAIGGIVFHQPAILDEDAS